MLESNAGSLQNDSMIDPLVAKMGVSRGLLRPAAEWDWPLHGLRHRPEGGTSGWYCWLGDLPDDADFFVPLHATHLIERWPAIAEYLTASPGSRFLLAPDYIDVWEDLSLLDP
jgi:hypothetical protein